MATTMKDAEIKFRTSNQLKRQTRDVYAHWGMSLSEAFNLFMRKSVEVGGLPFDVRPEPTAKFAGKETVRPDGATGVTVLPAWMDADEDDGLYDDLV